MPQKNISGTARKRGKTPKCYHYFGTGHMEVDQFKTDTLNRKPFDWFAVQVYYMIWRR